MAALSTFKIPKEEKVVPLASHEFSNEWDDSDLVLVVENQNLHVHSVILKMMSPVFKVMLSSDFKEKNQQQISLPEKKADEFVDFLRQMYPQFSNYKIQLDNIGHIYKLADEYQVLAVVNSCREVVEKMELTTDNLATVLILAQEMNSDVARKRCYNILQKMKVENLTGCEAYEVMDEKSVRDVLVCKAKRLEDCLKKIQPQLVGLMDCLMHLWQHPDNNYKMKGAPKKCSVHLSDTARPLKGIVERLKCEKCKKGFREMATKSSEVKHYNYISGGNAVVINYLYSSSGMYFDQKIVGILEEVFELLETKL